jgi:DsbC/DsbD-like thiol-disulfide interchange protein
MMICAQLAWAGARADERRVGLDVELVSEVTHARPGEPFYVGVWIRHHPGYHTYWREPGVVGMPTRMEWDLPRGWRGGELEYAEPESVLMFTIKCQGYERDVLLQAAVHPPRDLRPGDTVTLRGRAVWMCCAQSCHPGFKDLTLTLPVSDEPARADARWQPVFERERAAAPVASDAWSLCARLAGENKVLLEARPVSPQARKLSAALAREVIFFTGDGWIDTDRPHEVRFDEKSGGLDLLLPVSRAREGKRLPGALECLLQLPGGWERDGKPHTWLATPKLVK